MTNCVFSIEHLDVTLGGIEILGDCTFCVPPGVTCVMGLSGTGKSTLLKAMIGLIPACGGHIFFRDHDVTTASPDELAGIRRDVAYVFQGGALFSSLSVFDNCAFALRERDNLPEELVRSRVEESLEQVGLLHVAHRLPADLSGGMIKRAAIARALALRPYVMLFDEPTTGADPIITSVIMRHVRELTDVRPVASVVVTHDVDVVRRYADYVGLLIGGHMAWSGPPADLAHPENPIVRQFVAGSVEGPIPS